MRKSLYGHCIEQGDDTLLKQWHPTKNVSLTPRDVTSGSRQKVWWLCEKGHEWQAAVYTRTGGSGCPYCAGKRAYPGENDLTSQYPDIAAQWHPTKSCSVTPDSVTTGSHKRVWWQCNLGHIWSTKVYSRAGKQQSGCPVCAGRVSEEKQERYLAMMAD